VKAKAAPICVLALVAATIVGIRAITHDEDTRRIEGLSLALELPAGWNGYVSRPSPLGAPQLVAGNFRLPAEAGSVLRRKLPSGGARLVFWDYGPPTQPPPTEIPSVRRADLDGFEGAAPGYRSATHTFVAGGRLLRLVATFAGNPSDELLAEANAVLESLDVEPLVEHEPPTAQQDALWLQLVLVAAGFWSLSELDWDRQWNLALPTGGPATLYVWFTHAEREPEGRVEDDGVRAWWGAQGLTLWTEPVGNWEIRSAELRRLVRASMRIPRR
jgi:hypothetical protein